MREITLNVPRGIQYISEWKEYKLPYGKCIVDKGVTGCGYTELCLRNSDNIILCSPRKLLLENKRDQHIGDSNIIYLEAGCNMSVLISEHLNSYYNNGCKFMITYDSANILFDYLRDFGILGNFKIVVDEFQEIFLDAYFKASLENDFIEYLMDCPNVIYLSATPMLTKYLKMIDEFKDLDYYNLNWDNSGYVEHIKIKKINTDNLSKSCNKIIRSYLDGNYPTTFDRYSKRVVVSKEAVIYLNSITDIIKVVNKNKLTPNNTVILCSDSEENKKKLKRCKFEIGKIPLEHEPNPMFTFCTKSVFVGADFYSTNAKTYIFADPNLRCLALDISLDLPQIAGRQRNRLNSFKNTITMYYKNLYSNNISNREEFEKIQTGREDNSKIILSEFEKMTDKGQKVYTQKLESAIYHEMYCNDFISVSKKTGKPVYNKFIEIASERAWEVSQKDYQDSISLTRALMSVGDTIEGCDSASIISDFTTKYFFYTNFQDRLKVYCEFCDKYPELTEYFAVKAEEPRLEEFYKYYGTSGCKSKEYRKNELEKGFDDKSKELDLKSLLESEFIIGNTYTLKYIKFKIKDIYSKLGIQSSPKASILEEYFNVLPTKINSLNQKRENGYKIISII